MGQLRDSWILRPGVRGAVKAMQRAKGNPFLHVFKNRTLDHSIILVVTLVTAIVGIILLVRIDVSAAREASGSTPPGERDDNQASAVAPNAEQVALFEHGVLQKRSYSSRMRLVFLVGLEGTGHHYMADVLDKMCGMSQVQCPRVCALARVLYPDLTNPESPSAYRDARVRLREEVQALALSAMDLPEEKTTIIASFGACRFQAGLMSYPNFEGRDKVLQYVDFRIIAEEAERAGVDLRMIYLTRSALDILISDTQHSLYGGTFIKEARILLANAAVVESTFLELDPKFTTCFRYEDMSNSTQASRVAKFVAPTAESAEQLTETMLATVKHRRPSRIEAAVQQHHSANATTARRNLRPSRQERLLWLEHRMVNLAESEAHMLVVDRLQQKLDKIERDQCRRNGML